MIAVRVRDRPEPVDARSFLAHSWHGLVSSGEVTGTSGGMGTAPAERGWFVPDDFGGHLPH
jgi:hypothetical protein